MSIIQDLNIAFPFLEGLTIKEKYSTFDLESKIPIGQVSNLREDSLAQFSRELSKKTGSDKLTISFSGEDVGSIFFDLQNEAIKNFIENLTDLASSSDQNFLNLNFHIEKNAFLEALEFMTLCLLQVLSEIFKHFDS